MTDRRRPCTGDDGLAAEIALGLLTGRERSEALEHLRGCPPCRAGVDGLVEAADVILLAAPQAEPPTGFESGVLARLSPAAPLRHRWARPLVAAVAVVILGVGVLAGLRVARPREALTETAMVTPSGRDVGRVWRYEGRPSWLFVSVPTWAQHTRDAGQLPHYRLRVRLSSGETVDLDAAGLDEGDGSWGTATTFDTMQLRTVAIVDDTGTTWCTGRFS